MTRVEILEKIDALKEIRGVLTKDDLFEIGMMHRNLPTAQKDWTWLCEVTGWESSAEAYRSYVKSRMKRENILPVAINAPAVEGADLDKLTIQKHEIYKETQKLRDERTNLNKTLRDEARIERFKEVLTDAVSKLPELPKVEYTGDADDSGFMFLSGAEAIAMLSDLHIGMEIDSYCNTYNLDIAAKRLGKWVKDVIKYCQLNSVVRLNVVNLGDLVSGIIHESIRLQQEFDVATQVMQAGELLAQALVKLQEAAPEVIYRSCTDNHSRFTPDKNQHLEKESWCKLIDWFLTVRLQSTNIKMVNDNLSDSLGKFYLMNGKTVMFAHGHLDKPNSSFQNFIGATEEYVHYVLLGHYHCEKTKYFQNMKVLINGSICGTDPYAESIRKYTKPAQTLLVFDDDNLINYSINLDIK